MTPPTRASVAAAVAAFPRRDLPLDGRRPAAVALACVEEEAGTSLLLTRRAPRMRAHAGQWALPGGRLDAGETAVEAALRELEEELGLRVPASDVLGLLDDYGTRSGYVITPVVVWTRPSGPLAPNPGEVASVHRVLLGDLDVDPLLEDSPGSPAPVLALPLLGGLLHAPTAALLHQFREVALHGRATRVAHVGEPAFAWR